MSIVSPPCIQNFGKRSGTILDFLGALLRFFFWPLPGPGPVFVTFRAKKTNWWVAIALTTAPSLASQRPCIYSRCISVSRVLTVLCVLCFVPEIVLVTSHNTQHWCLHWRSLTVQPLGRGLLDAGRHWIHVDKAWSLLRMTRTQMGLYYGGTVAKEYLTKVRHFSYFCWLNAGKYFLK